MDILVVLRDMGDGLCHVSVLSLRRITGAMCPHFSRHFGGPYYRAEYSKDVARRLPLGRSLRTRDRSMGELVHEHSQDAARMASFERVGVGQGTLDGQDRIVYKAPGFDASSTRRTWLPHGFKNLPGRPTRGRGRGGGD